ncbi:MAG TPA: hypothetical protein VFW03_25455, partial [Gemmatimonadaceae bacterium]|nr:hypothetical protein [Gemmatimonadaceae bacterium]
MGAPSGNPRDVVVFVHGTFACSDADEGTAWWQRGSDFWNWMKANLPPDTELPETGPAFRWTGINSESARMQGAKALLLRLQSYESAGVGYHVVAHSHGGSVVWTALHLARHGVDVKELKSLRSWTTVGTPFLVPEPSPAATFARLWDAILLVGIAVVADAHYFGFLRRVSPVFFVTLVCSLFLAL